MDILKDNPLQVHQKPELVPTKPINVPLEFDTTEAQQIGKVGHEFDVDPQAIVLSVGQRGIGIAHADEYHQILQTQELGTCIALGIYDKEERVAALMHIDSLTDISRGIDMFLKALKNKESPVQITLIGGSSASDGDKQKSAALITKTIQVLNAKLDPSIQEVELQAIETLGDLKRQVLLDVNTGATTVLYHGPQGTAHPYYEPNAYNDPFKHRSHETEEYIYVDTGYVKRYMQIQTQAVKSDFEIQNSSNPREKRKPENTGPVRQMMNFYDLIQNDALEIDLEKTNFEDLASVINYFKGLSHLHRSVIAAYVKEWTKQPITFIEGTGKVDWDNPVYKKLSSASDFKAQLDIASFYEGVIATGSVGDISSLVDSMVAFCKIKLKQKKEQPFRNPFSEEITQGALDKWVEASQAVMVISSSPPAK